MRGIIKKSGLGGQKNLLILISIVIICWFNIWLITSPTPLTRMLTLLLLAIGLIYFVVNLEQAWILFTLAFILPLGLYITKIPNLRACEFVIPFLFVLVFLHRLVLREPGRRARIIPLSLILFFGLGFISFLRHPSLPTQVFSRTVDLGNFRNYWNFFIGIQIYLLSFYLFRQQRQKYIALLKLLAYTYVLMLILHIAMAIFRIPAMPGFLAVNWGPLREGSGGAVTFRGGFFGQYGLNLLLIVITFPIIFRNRFIRTLIFLLAVFALVGSGARSILLSAFACAILYFILRKKLVKLMAPLLILGAILFISYSNPGVIESLPRPFQRVFVIFPASNIYGQRGAVVSAQWRLEWWEEAWRIIRQRPVFGVGLRKVGREFLYQPVGKLLPIIGSVHNIYLGTGLMLGLSGLGLLLWIFYLHLKRGIILFQSASNYFSRQFNLWLVLSIFSYNIVYFFGGSPHTLYPYFFYAGLINANWIRDAYQSED